MMPGRKCEIRAKCAIIMVSVNFKGPAYLGVLRQVRGVVERRSKSKFQRKWVTGDFYYSTGENL